MPMPTRWTKEACLAVQGLIQTGKTKHQIETLVGYTWDYIVKQMSYHSRQEVLHRKRMSDPSYQHLTITTPTVLKNGRPFEWQMGLDKPVPGEGPQTEDEAIAVAELYKPRVKLPPRLAQKYGGRKAFG